MTDTPSAVPALDGRPSPPALADQEARNAVTAVLDRNLFVEAGAGSGKTRSLVERVLALVEAGERLDQIVVITFTEAAATELRTRIRAGLAERYAAAEARHDSAVPRIAEALSAVDTAPITTLHGFALRILSDHPIEAGLPPGFSVTDEVVGMVEFERAWTRFRTRIGDDLDLLDLQARAAARNVKLSSFAAVARQLDDNWDRLSFDSISPSPPEPLELASSLDAIVALESLLEGCVDPEDALGLWIRRQVGMARRLRSASALDQLEWLDGIRWKVGKTGRAGGWSEPSVREARSEIAGVAEGIDARLQIESDVVVGTLGALVKGFVADRVASRAAEGQLTFHDLLVRARRLLRSNEAVRQRLGQQYRRILLDEFQDTDPLQIELAVLLAADEPVGETPWPELAERLPPGRLVVVGDPKQSIYRFRRADIRVFDQAGGALADSTTRLVTNFRSVPGIVDFVNQLFGDEMAEGEPGAQPPYTPLVAHRPPISMQGADSPQPVVVLGVEHEEKAAGEIRRAEANDVAAVICRIMADEWPVVVDGEERPARLSDIAILIPSRLSLPALESSLGAAGIPFRPETSSLVYATQEVREVLAAVRSVADPGSEIDVVAALRSALFAVTDDDLLAWHRQGGRWDYRVAAPEAAAASPVAEAFAVLDAWYHDRLWTEPSQLIDRIVRERRLREQALAVDRPRDRWRRYRFLIEQAREFSAQTSGDLTDFVAWAELQASDLARVIEPVPAETDDDSVRILTIHGSKGLEFNITVLAGASTVEQQTFGRGPVVLFDEEGGEPRIRIRKDRATSDFEVQASVEESLDRHERVRLHYVAATRARDWLIVSAHHKVGRTSMGSRTAAAVTANPELVSRFVTQGEVRYENRPPSQLRLVATSADVDTWQREQDELLRANRGSWAISATGIADLVSDQPDLSDVENTEARPWRQGRAGTAIGSAVHAVLQKVDLSDPDRVDELSALEAEREAIGELSGRVAQLARLALASPDVRRAASSRFWRELYVAVPAFEGGVLEGYVDLVYEANGGLVVVDYKTDPVRSSDDAKRLLTNYRWQGAAYAYAVARVAEQPIVAVRFVFLSGDEAVTVELDDLDGAVAEVEAVVSRRTRETGR